MGDVANRHPCTPPALHDNLSVSISGHQRSYADVVSTSALKAAVTEAIREYQQVIAEKATIAIYGFPEEGHDQDQLSEMLTFLNCQCTVLWRSRIGRLATSPVSANRLHRRIDYQSLTHQLQHINWTAHFSNSKSADDYAFNFTTTLSNAIENSAKYQPRFHRKRLPRHIVKFIRAKKKARRAACHTGDYAKFKAASRTSRAALSQHQRCEEMRIIYSRDNKQLFLTFPA
jgi:hypothetical protein